MSVRLAGMLTLLTAALGAGGCSDRLDLAATEVLNHGNCKNASDGLTAVTYAEVAELRGSTLLGMTEAPREAQEPAVELLLFALSNGRQPTPGYYFKLLDAQADGDTAELLVAWHTPPKDSVQPQMVTHPCMVVGLEKGNFARVRAIDEAGDVLGEVHL